MPGPVVLVVRLLRLQLELWRLLPPEHAAQKFRESGRAVP